MSNKTDSAQAAPEVAPSRSSRSVQSLTPKPKEQEIAQHSTLSVESIKVKSTEKPRHNNDGTSVGGSQSYKKPKTSEKPTTPPRISWGVEIEFLVAYLASDKSDPDPDLDLPPVFDETMNSIIKRMANCLLDHGIPVKVSKYGCVSESLPQRRAEVGANDANSWTIDTDATVEEFEELDYNWTSVEITSPASYAYDEAMEMIEIVTTLIKANFRTRINTSCGLHVHVGNGRQRIDFRAARNYAALFWAAEPLLSTLFIPDRTINSWSQSLRRVKYCRLSKGEGEANAYEDAMNDPRWPARYHGRARKLGESTIASREKFLRRVKEKAVDSEGCRIEPECPSDDSDWEAESQPFHRPKKTQSKRNVIYKNVAQAQLDITGRLPNEDEIAQLDACRVIGGPPTINFQLPDEIRQLYPRQESQVPPDSPGYYAEPGTTPIKAPTLERLQSPMTERQIRLQKPRSLESMSRDEQMMRRLDLIAALPDGMVNGSMGEYTRVVLQKQPLRRDCWSGVKEIMHCDVGLHQISYLMGGNFSKSTGSNWLSSAKEMLTVVQGTAERFSKGNTYMTIENRYASGSLDGKWIATWAKINIRLLEWARDAEPAALMRVLALLAEEDERAKVEYDVIDFLEDIGCFAEARHCEERLRRGAEAQYECMLLKQREGAFSDSFEDGSSSTQSSISVDTDLMNFGMDPSILGRGVTKFDDLLEHIK